MNGHSRFVLLMIYHLHWKWQLNKNLLTFNISSNFRVLALEKSPES